MWQSYKSGLLAKVWGTQSSTLGRQMQMNFYKSQPGLYTEFQASQGCIVFQSQFLLYQENCTGI